MATEEEVIAVHPGDIIQATVQGPIHGHFLFVTETQRWGVGAVLRWFDPDLQEDREVYHRMKPGTFAVVGTAAIMPPEVAAARRDSLATARAVAREAGQ